MELRHFGRGALLRVAATFGLGALMAKLAAPAEAAKVQPATLEGAWMTTISGVTPKPFRVTAVYGAGGVFVGSGTVDEQPPSSPAYGAWTQTGPRKFRSHLVFWTFDKSGSCSGVVHFHEEITLGADSNRYEATCLQEVSDLNGRLLSTSRGAESADRIEV